MVLHTFQLDSLTSRSLEVLHLFQLFRIREEELLALLQYLVLTHPNRIAKLSWHLFMFHDEAGQFVLLIFDVLS